MSLILPNHPQPTPAHQVIEKHPGYRWIVIIGVLILTPLSVMLGIVGLRSQSSDLVNAPNIVDFTANETEVQQDDAMRRVHGVSLLYYAPDAKDGVPMKNVLQYSFGFCNGYLIQTSYDAHNVLNDDPNGDYFEVHQLDEGQWFLIGFVGLDTYSNLTYNPKSGTRFTIYRHRWLGAPRIISIPIKHLVTTNRRGITPEDDGKTITVLDAEWN